MFLKILFCLLTQFSKEVLANIYSAYIDNFLNAKDAVRIAKEAKPAFMKFLEVCFSSPMCVPLGFTLLLHVCAIIFRRCMSIIQWCN